MESRSPRLSVEQLYSIKWYIGAAMGLVSISSLFNATGHGLGPAWVAAAAIGAGLCFPRQLAKLPPVAWQVYTVAIIPLVALDFLSGDTLTGLLNLNTWLILYRSLNHSRRREEMQLVLLCLFLLVMVGILTATLTFGLQLLLFAALSAAFLVTGSLLDYRVEGDEDRMARLQAEARLSGLFELLGACRFRLVFLGGALFCSLLGLSALVFLVIPRIDVEDRALLMNLSSRATYTGLSDRMSLGEVTNIKQDNRVALRVDAPEGAVLPETPYWRALALDRYRNGAFSLSREMEEQIEGPSASPYSALRHWPDRRFSQRPSEEARDRWTFFLEPNVSRFLPVPGAFERMTLAALDDLRIGPQLHVFAQKTINAKLLTYQLEGVRVEGHLDEVAFEGPIPAVAGEGPGGFPNSLLELPLDEASLARLREVAAEIEGGERLGGPAFAARATRYLRERHGYSLSSRLEASGGPIEDPVVRWLVGTQPGHCEFFAGSLVLLARAAGHPARVAVGYAGGSWNGYEDYFMVRNADAHAWVEIYDGQGRWVRVDPTPGGATPGQPRPPAVAGVERAGETGASAYLDSLRMLWYRRIVNFDEQAQRAAAMQLKDFFLAYAQVAEEWGARAAGYVYAWLTGDWSVGRLLYVAGLLSLLLVAYWAQRNLTLNARELLLAPFRRGDPVRRKAGALLRRLQASEAGSEAAAAEATIEDLRRLRFGPRERWPNARRVFRDARRLR